MGNAQPSAVHDKLQSTIVFDTRDTFFCCGGGVRTADEGYPSVCTPKEYTQIVSRCYPVLGQTGCCQLGGHWWLCQYPVDPIFWSELQDDYPHLQIFIERIWVDVCVVNPHWEYVVSIRKGYQSDYYRHKLNLPPLQKNSGYSQRKAPLVYEDKPLMLPPTYDTQIKYLKQRKLDLEAEKKRLAAQAKVDAKRNKQLYLQKEEEKLQQLLSQTENKKQEAEKKIEELRIELARSAAASDLELQKSLSQSSKPKTAEFENSLALAVNDADKEEALLLPPLVQDQPMVEDLPAVNVRALADDSDTVLEQPLLSKEAPQDDQGPIDEFLLCGAVRR